MGGVSSGEARKTGAEILEELNKVYAQDEFIGEELKLYFESLFDTEY